MSDGGATEAEKLGTGVLSEADSGFCRQPLLDTNSPRKAVYIASVRMVVRGSNGILVLGTKWVGSIHRLGWLELGWVQKFGLGGIVKKIAQSVGFRS